MTAKLVTTGSGPKKGKGKPGGRGASLPTVIAGLTSRYFCSSCGFNSASQPKNNSCPTCGSKVGKTVA